MLLIAMFRPSPVKSVLMIYLLVVVSFPVSFQDSGHLPDLATYHENCLIFCIWLFASSSVITFLLFPIGLKKTIYIQSPD